MIIDGFISRYEGEYDYYQAVARLCEQHCETNLRHAGIRVIVTSRAKNHARLRKKIDSVIQEKIIKLYLLERGIGLTLLS